MGLKVCVIKGTLKALSGPDPSIESMKQDALNSGYTENEIEFIDEDEYFNLLKQQDKEQSIPSLEERVNALELLMLEQILSLGEGE